MYKLVSLVDFIETFKDYDRDDNFSPAGLYALYNYLESYERDTGEQIKLDVIALCCEYTEYLNLEEYNREYPAVESIEEIEQKTTVIRIPDLEGFIIQAF